MNPNESNYKYLLPSAARQKRARERRDARMHDNFSMPSDIMHVAIKTPTARASPEASRTGGRAARADVSNNSDSAATIARSGQRVAEGENVNKHQN